MWCPADMVDFLTKDTQFYKLFASNSSVSMYTEPWCSDYMSSRIVLLLTAPLLVGCYLILVGLVTPVFYFPCSTTPCCTSKVMVENCIFPIGICGPSLGINKDSQVQPLNEAVMGMLDDHSVHIPEPPLVNSGGSSV